MGLPIVTLTTDWGDGSFFAGMVKGRLCSLVDDVRVVDICHHVEPYKITSATFIVRNACMGFPPGTVHIIDVASQPPYLVVKAHGQYFLCCDNALPVMAFGDAIEDVSLLQVDGRAGYSFVAWSLFAGAAAMLLKGASMRDLGECPTQLKKRYFPDFMQQDADYRIYVHYIDGYGNAYLGMTYKKFLEITEGRRFVLMVREQMVTEVMTSYYQEKESNDPRHKLRLIVSATGLLELAIKEGSLAQLVGIKVGDSVLLRFRD